jgi:hypothetical protein
MFDNNVTQGDKVIARRNRKGKRSRRRINGTQRDKKKQGKLRTQRDEGERNEI